MRRAICLLALAAASAFAQPAADSPPAAEASPVSQDSLVRVNSTNQAYDFFRPWVKKNPFPRRGLGVILPGGRVLVTAELIANRTYVELEKPGSAEKSPADVIVVDYDCNLALLRPSNPDFFKAAKPVALAAGARVGDRTEILQLESNGQVAQTPGVITTIAVSDYPFDRPGMLTYRLSAPLQNREGSFTIPAMRRGRLLGLLMRYDSRSQTAELIPPPVISHFLADAEKIPYPGFPRVGVSFEPTRDPQLRRYIGLNGGGGVYVTDVVPDGPAEKAGLKRGDVILAVDGKAIDQDGNYTDPDYGRISFSHLTNTLAKTGDVLDFTILRNREQLKLPVTLAPANRSRMVSEPYVMDRQPRYLILGGLVFEELSRPYLLEWGGNWRKEAPQRLVYLDAFQNELGPDRGKVVFLSQVLPGPSTLGYEPLEHLVVSKVNEIPIKSLDDLARAVAAPENGFHKIEFDEDPGVIYLDAEEIRNGREQLMKDYSLPALENL